MALTRLSRPREASDREPAIAWMASIMPVVPVTAWRATPMFTFASCTARRAPSRCLEMSEVRAVCSTTALAMPVLRSLTSWMVLVIRLSEAVTAPVLF